MRRLFRIHLSTAIVLMLLAAAFLGLNVVKRAEAFRETGVHSRGWPLTWEMKYLVKLSSWSTGPTLERSPSNRTESSAASNAENTQEFHAFDIRRTRHWRIAGNIAVALTAMVAIAALMEWRLRKRAA